MFASRAWILLLVPLAVRAADAPSFTKDVAPLLRERCLKCHSGKSPRGDLDLTRRSAMLTGGTHGPAVNPGKPGDSLLFTHARDGKMPPKKPLAENKVELLRRWVEAGAKWEGP